MLKYSLKVPLKTNNEILDLPTITDDELPYISILTPTYNRPEFAKLMVRNYLKIDYPREKLEWIVVSDHMDNTLELIKKELPINTSPLIKLIQIKDHLTIGQKRNLLCSLAKYNYLVHMDDDDFYPEMSVIARIRTLLYLENLLKEDRGLVGCSKVNCYDLLYDKTFEAFDPDPSDSNEHLTISESTLCYTKKFWSLNKFNNSDTITECLHLIKNQYQNIMIIPSYLVITQFTHTTNTVSRRFANEVKELGYNFVRDLVASDQILINDLKASILAKNPEYQRALQVVKNCYKNIDNSKKLKEIFEILDKNWKIPFAVRDNYTIVKNPLILQVRRDLLIEHFEERTIVYYCGPGSYLKFSNKWSPTSKNIGGSEEAVINISRQLVKKNFKIIVYCVLDSPLLEIIDQGVLYRQYFQWTPKSKTYATIIWRDPSNVLDIINSNKIFLDLHDAINPEWLKDTLVSLKDVKIMVKSFFHKNILGLGKNAIVIPNGINRNSKLLSISKQKNLIINTSSPDRCLSALLRALPLIRKVIPDAEIHWAYGFKMGLVEGGLESDNRPEISKWVIEIKELMKNTEGFVDLGRLSFDEIDKLYAKAEYFIYGTNFPEIDCISLTKALSYHCIPIVSKVGALSEKLTKEVYLGGIILPNDFDTSLKEGPEFDKWVSDIIETMSNNVSNNNYGDIYSKYNWASIANRWMNLL